MDNTLIRFPNLGIEVHVGKYLTIFGIKIAFYGIMIGLGMLVGALLAFWLAKKTKQNLEDYIDFCIIVLITSIVGARLYYVIFEWQYYGAHPAEIITGIREGGLAIYGGIIAAVITLWLFTKKRKLKFSLMADTSCFGLLAGQIIGRWGNFFNREAFGGYTDNTLAMMLPANEANGVNSQILSHIISYQGANYVQVHPTFLYEGMWNLALLILLFVYFKHKKFDGELFALYLAGYGLGRMWIEALRTDQLLLWPTNIPVSQLLSFLLVIGATIYLSMNYYHIFLKKAKKKAADTVKK